MPIFIDKEISNCLELASTIADQVEQANNTARRDTGRDFSPLQFFSIGEVTTTHILAYFLRDTADHGQGRLFQDLFFQRLRQSAIGARLPQTTWHVEAENRYAGIGQLDLLLTSADRSFGICIENKPRDQTADQDKQLLNYQRFLISRHQDRYALIYLSRTPRSPGEHSLDKASHKQLIDNNAYINLTYHDFLLPLLHQCSQASIPENIRYFLQSFCHRLEDWLSAPSTKPARRMQSQEIAAELAKSPTHVRAAFAIMASHDALRTQLLTSLAASLQHPLPGLVGAVHEQWGGFFEKTQGKPFLIRRQTGATAEPANWPWGRFAIGLEFDRGRFFYGIRFDEAGWHSSRPDTASMPENAAADLAHQLGTNSCRWEYWPWWQWASVANDEALCLSIVEGTLLPELISKIQRLTEVLDLYCNVPSPAVAI